MRSSITLSKIPATDAATRRYSEPMESWSFQSSTPSSIITLLWIQTTANPLKPAGQRIVELNRRPLPELADHSRQAHHQREFYPCTMDLHHRLTRGHGGKPTANMHNRVRIGNTTFEWTKTEKKGTR
jgi:hypothetical protein